MKDNAIIHYQKFLQIWENADIDFIQLIDAKVRLASLKKE